MIQQKNKWMLLVSTGTVLLSVLIHVLQRNWQVFEHTMGGMAHGIDLAAWSGTLNVLLAIPALLLAAAAVLYRMKSDHRSLPLLLTLTMTSSSFSIIAGGGGTVEFHFSIFMVIAFVAFYEHIPLLLLMTVLFAVQHLIGYFVAPELVFGVSSYPFLMLVTHALFLVLTSGATAWLLRSKKKLTDALEAEKEQKQQVLLAMIGGVKKLSSDLDSMSSVISRKSDELMQASDGMLVSFQEVSTGLGVQSDSVVKIEQDLHDINEMIGETSQASDEMKGQAERTGTLLNHTIASIRTLYDQIHVVSGTIDTSASTIRSLHHSSQKVGGIIATIQEVSDQTNLLSLNASIEAARSGEHGKGFAVVAAEIRKLADQSRKATDEIKDILTKIAADSQASVQQIEVGKEATMRSVAQAEASIEGLHAMQQVSGQLLAAITELNLSVREVEQSSSGIATEMANISAVTEQSIAAVREVFDSTEGQVASNRMVNEELHRLKELSFSLQKQFAAQEA